MILSAIEDMSAVCASCRGPLTVDIAHASDDSDNGMSSNETVPDDVKLACGDHFHWQCLMDSSFEITKCPSCENDVSIMSQQDVSSNSNPQILVTLNNEGGLQQDIDLFPVLQEECYLKTYPEERRPRAFLEFCREGDHQAAVGVLTSTDDEDEEAEEIDQSVNNSAMRPALDPDAILRYQDPLAGEQSALHAAAANGHREIAWLLLLLASDYPELDIPALVHQEAAALGLMRQDQVGKSDIRSLRDAQGRTAEDVAKETGDVIWNGWFGVGRLSI